MSDKQRDELADLIAGVAVYVPGSHGDDCISPNAAADAILSSSWLARVKREAAAEALEEAARDMNHAPEVPFGAPRSRYWLEARAAAIRTETTS